MRGNYVDDFIQPLVKLGMRPKGDLVAIAEALDEDLPSVTRHQLQSAVRAVRQTWKYASTFPPISFCLAAIRAAPVREVDPTSAPARVCEERPHSDPPILVRARRFCAEYEGHGERGRVLMEQQFPGRYAASLAVLTSYGES